MQKLSQVIAAFLDRGNPLQQAQLHNRSWILVTKELEVLHQRIGVFFDACQERVPALWTTLKAMHEDYVR